MSGVTVREAMRRLGVSRSRVYAMIDRGQLGVVTRTGQPRRGGRFAAGGTLLDPEDVAREAEARGRGDVTGGV